ncbi:GNAT family N-acetyltransferase [Amphiplicatus metriothermophilus]|uniref:Uncharacterized protein n=1 Tax=Amphiplicatus metriothermophilus TaxID=1519374 RepID=A0A239PNV7_9PROT|nr:GNAT family N-acetyltransferase [Amphiplicatus metriothermophilus]MBB5518882.1 hypothetical protein [Amphiplicatus metriothermophilus]SNT71965.1 hypothetical protein SAMN06297382_0987 [Amphiplicatus metriothermophilus]
MADGGDLLSARTASAIAEIGRETWDSVANPPAAPYNPFLAYDFLASLEESGSVAPEAGWAPAHVALEENGRPVGVAPLYVKSHSQGEYVFDHHWADAYERAGGRYYPKLVCAVPFTPAPGPRLLAADETRRRALAAAIVQIAKRFGVSSVHANFLSAQDAAHFAAQGFLPRAGAQYHWFNRGYATFDDFLAALSARKRKAVRRERREALSAGLVVRHLSGAEITERYWDAFWRFYQDTGARKWGRPYLTRAFFSLIAERMGERVLLIVAEREGVPIAGALNFIGGDALYGRYWGCTEHHPFLHFELCYYQAVEYAIERGLARVEAGAQGEHKIARGYEPVETRSAHWIADPGFREAVARYLAQERAQNAAEIDFLKEYAPFRRG